MESKRIALYILLFLVVLCIVFLPGFSELHKLREENAQLQQRIRLLEEYNHELKNELLKMQQDPGSIEKKAREKLGIVKKGEIIYKKTGGD
ncbi:MAG: septum formation initiator family protein [Candidatus Omnitrophota bacterium]